MTDLEDRLSAALHREAAHLVPDTTVPPPLQLPAPQVGGRWRGPLLVAAAVLVVAVGVTVAVRSHRDDSTAPAVRPSAVLTSPTSAFPCFDAKTSEQVMTLHAARAGMFRIGVTANAFCETADVGGGTGGSSLQPSGALRSWVSDDVGVAGVVDPSVDRVVWIPRGTDEKSGTTLDLYSLGQLNGFAVAIQSSGSLLVYSGTSELAREQVPFPGEGSSPVASSAAAFTFPTSTPAGDESQGSTQAIRSYPPGQGPTPKPGTWQTNARGQTYGSAADANGATGQPDLIAAVATNGKTGYVLRTDLELPSPTNQSEALAQNTAGPRTIPVYQSDGITKIGVFVVDGTASADGAPPPGNIIASSAATR